MKKHLLLFSSILFLGGIVVLSCSKKKSSGISPTYGTTYGNPNPNNTVTGNTPTVNLATENSSLPVGGSGWSNPTCGTTSSLALKGNNGVVDVTLSFASTIYAGTYQVGLTPGANVCGLTVLNAPNQPAGIYWYGKSGTVTIANNGPSISATLSSVVCAQLTFNYPTVVVSGSLSCGQ